MLVKWRSPSNSCLFIIPEWIIFIQFGNRCSVEHRGDACCWWIIGSTCPSQQNLANMFSVLGLILCETIILRHTAIVVVWLGLVCLTLSCCSCFQPVLPVESRHILVYGWVWRCSRFSILSADPVKRPKTKTQDSVGLSKLYHFPNLSVAVSLMHNLFRLFWNKYYQKRIQCNFYWGLFSAVD